MTKYEIAIRLLAEYCDCPSKDGTTVDLPMEWCENHCKYEGDDIGHEETLQCWEKTISDRYGAQGEDDKKEPCEDNVKPEPCEDAVSRAEAKRILFDFAGCIVDTPNGIYQQAYKKYNDMMDNLPCVTPKPKTGKWIQHDARFPWSHHYECSECGNTIDMSGLNAGRGDANYCPNCGAKMEEEDANTHT